MGGERGGLSVVRQKNFKRDDEENRNRERDTLKEREKMERRGNRYSDAENEIWMFRSNEESTYVLESRLPSISLPPSPPHSHLPLSLALPTSPPLPNFSFAPSPPTLCHTDHSAPLVEQDGPRYVVQLLECIQALLRFRPLEISPAIINNNRNLDEQDPSSSFISTNWMIKFAYYRLNRMQYRESKDSCRGLWLV